MLLSSRVWKIALEHIWTQFLPSILDILTYSDTKFLSLVHRHKYMCSLHNNVFTTYHICWDVHSIEHTNLTFVFWTTVLFPSRKILSCLIMPCTHHPEALHYNAALPTSPTDHRSTAIPYCKPIVTNQPLKSHCMATHSIAWWPTCCALSNHCQSRHATSRHALSNHLQSDRLTSRRALLSNRHQSDCVTLPTHKSTARPSSPTTFVHPFDIIYNNSTSHPGNIGYHAIIASNSQRYSSCSTDRERNLY